MSEKLPVRIRLSVLHAAFDEARRASFARLHETLLQECRGLEDEIDLHVYRELSPRGSLPGWLRTLEDGVRRHRVEGAFERRAREFTLASEFTREDEERDRDLGRFAPTHLVFLPDDVTLCRGFAKALLRAVRARPDDVLCALSNHHGAFGMMAEGARWYATRDGFAAFAGTLPVRFAADHLAWREQNLLPPKEGDPALRTGQDRGIQGDEGVNLHLMAIGRPCYKMLPSLVQHDEPDGSLDGSTLGVNCRRSLAWAPPEQDVDVSRVPFEETEKTFDGGRTYQGNHWSLVYDTKTLTPELVEAAYAAEREGGAFDQKPIKSSKDAPHVYIVVPEYQPAVPAQRASLSQTVKDLRDHGIEVTFDAVAGHSLVTRARNWGCVHKFMLSTANVLFQWDGDVECLDEAAVRKMLETGHPMVGGAYPYRDDKGGICATLPKKAGGRDVERELKIDDDGTCVAHEVATGFLLVRREMLVDLMTRHPELVHAQDGGPYVGQPAWALFDTRLEEQGPGRRRRYLSEDWEFSRLAREAGYTPRLYLPPVFRHWGLVGCEGHALVGWGDKTWEEVYGDDHPKSRTVGASRRQATGDRRQAEQKENGA
jgi:hypothetical protein